jgi:hypothetical protein
MAAIGAVLLGREGAAPQHRGVKQSEVCFPDIDAMHLLRKITGEIEARSALRGAVGSREEAGAYAHSCAHSTSDQNHAGGMLKVQNAVRERRAFLRWPEAKKRDGHYGRR